MADEGGAYPLGGAAALEHLTGPSRGTVTWLSGSALDISLSARRFLHVADARAGEPRDDLIARLHRADDTYEIAAFEDQPVWVNGVRITSRKLEHRDMIEFGQSGPLSRFRLYGDHTPVRKMAADILSDGLVYLRVSRQPLAIRFFLGVYGIVRRLMQETTLLFRIGVIIAIVGLSTLAYHQNQLNTQLQQRIEKGASRLEGFAAALTRARHEALTPGDLTKLRQELGHRLTTASERLTVLERRSEASGRVISASISSILFLQGAYAYRDVASGRMLRHVVDKEGRPLISPIGQPLLTLEDSGPVAERHFIGTGFAIGDNGLLVTNRHVAEPWENDASVEDLALQGLQPVMVKFIAFTPGKAEAEDVELVKASKDADLAILRRTDPSTKSGGLKLADESPAAGDEVIVMGYPTGLRSMLAQSGAAFIEELQQSEDTGFWSVAARLAKKGHIAPLASRGIVSQVTPATIVYDAETTHGGSGGPVLDTNGAVVAVNAAILPEYGGSNLGVPVLSVRALLEAIEPR